MKWACLGVLLALVPATFAQQVTDTKWVESGKNQRELLRKINGRWWSQDNREVYPPSPGGFFWVLDSKPGVVDFYHHRPFRLDRAESLHLWMTQQDVEAMLGQPNRIFGRDSNARWYYYAANGTKVDLWFVAEGVLGEAKYTAVGEKSWPVASVERDLAGRNLFQLLAERARQRLGNSSRPGANGFRASTPAVPVARPTEPEVPAKKRIVSAEAFAAIAVGTGRDDLLNKLGEPSSRYAITDDDGTRESFTYDLDNGETVTVRLLNSKVVKMR